LDQNLHQEQYTNPDLNDPTGSPTNPLPWAKKNEYPDELPSKLRVLFCDDDPILRKLFKRTAKTVAPEWTFREASNGETALKLVETEEFDLIFIDM
jgi:response regulator RpfG family c-di-GMP phosphodiesterase